MKHLPRSSRQLDPKRGARSWATRVVAVAAIWSLLAADVARSADLSGAKLLGLKLRGARYNVSSRWPGGYDPRRHGAVLVK